MKKRSHAFAYCLGLCIGAAFVGSVWIAVHAGGQPSPCRSGTRGVVEWNRYAGSKSSIDERPPKGDAETVRVTVCNDRTAIWTITPW